MAALCLLPLASCQKEMPGRLDGMYSSAPSSETASADPAEIQSDTLPESPSVTVKTPSFRSGKYRMASTAVYEQFLRSGASVAAHIKRTQTYTYDIALTVGKDGAMKAVYTFRRVRMTYEDSETYTMDTDDKKGRDDESAAFYDLIGQSVTVNVAGDGKLTVSGVDKIHKKVPAAKDIVTADNMKEVAADLFYPIADKTLTAGSSWQLTQSGIVNTYTVSKCADSGIVVTIAGGVLTVPEPFTVDDIRYTYQECAPLSGSLVIDATDRAVQEQSSYQANQGTADYNGKTYAFQEISSSVCTIEKQ